jgi:hypothetical protein
LQAILYLETNFLVGFATGRSLKASAFLTEPIGPILLVIPGVCFMEAFTVLGNEERGFNRFKELVDDQIRAARRNVVFPGFPAVLVQHLEAARIARERVFRDYRSMLNTAIDELCRSGEVIASPAGIVHKSLHTILIEDPTDNLILTTIIHHAESHPSPVKAFLSENSKDFGEADAKKALEMADVKYFRDAGNCMGWLKAQVGT